MRPRRASILLVGEGTAAAALREGQPLVVGRALPSDLVLADRSLSRVHARVTWEGEGLLVEDLDSTNGVFVDTERVQTASISTAQSVALGSVRLVAHVSTFAGSSERIEKDTFRLRLELEIARSRAFRRSFTVFAIRWRGADERGWERVLQECLRPVDAMTSISAEVALVCIAEAGSEEREPWGARFRSILGDREIRVGAALYPEQAEESDALVRAALEALAKARPDEIGSAVSARPHAGASASVIIESPPMRALYDLVARVGRTRMPILVLGETGAGKELVASAVHGASQRASGPFRAVNCATIPANLTESALFGHEKGAFTSANARSKGLFEQAEGGTVFLDEIGELPLHAQAALLRVLETGRITRVGGTEEIAVDVRIVAATHRDLAAMVGEGTFREDLLYRLDAMTLEVPALRDRVEDVPLLARAFLRRAHEQWDAPVLDFHPAVLDAFCAYHWPGNVRQLRNLVDRAAAIAVGPVITLDDLPPDVARSARVATGVDAPTQAAAGRSLTDRVHAFEREVLRETLEQVRGNQSRAAEILGVPRRTLAHKVKRHGLA